MTGLINPVFFVGVVEDRLDPRLEGRVKVRAFGFHGSNQEIQTEDLPWATLVLGHHSPNFVPPPLNSWVIGFFADGRDAQQPMIMGIIPTQMVGVVDPATNGYGAISSEDHSLHSKGHRPEDYGQPMLSASARGEYALTSPHVSQEANKITDAKIAGSDSTWSESGSAYNPQYPFNHVFETAGGHTIEVDDTPGAERIFVYHKAGSYVQIDTVGNTTLKSASDMTTVTEGNHHVYIGSNGGGAKNIVTIMGDSLVYVDGDKIEEVRGNSKQIVRGDYILDVAGRMSLNASDETQLRSAKLTFESNVEHISFNAAKDFRITSTEGLHLKTKNFISETAEKVSFKTQEFFVDAAASLSLKTATFAAQASGTWSAKAGKLVMGSAGNASLSAPTLYVDDIVRFSEGGSEQPPAIEASAPSAPAAITTQMPEPPARSIRTSDFVTRASYGSASYGSNDDSSSGISTSSDSIGDASVSAISNPVAVRTLYDYMRDAGLSHIQAVGALVNVQRESNFNSGAVGDNGNSFGLFQFNLPGGRGRPFLNAVPDWQTNAKGQIMFMFNQDPLGKSYKNREFSSTIEAANWFTNRVEIPMARASYTAQGGYNSVNLPQIEKLVSDGSATV